MKTQTESYFEELVNSITNANHVSDYLDSVTVLITKYDMDTDAEDLPVNMSLGELAKLIKQVQQDTILATLNVVLEFVKSTH